VRGGLIAPLPPDSDRGGLGREGPRRPGLPTSRGAGLAMDIILYTRRGCHLCEAVEDLLPHHAPQARIVEVGDDGDLEREYGLRVPVLIVDGRPIAEGRIDEATLIVALAAALTTRD
jgi:glutaredoxin